MATTSAPEDLSKIPNVQLIERLVQQARNLGLTKDGWVQRELSQLQTETLRRLSNGKAVGNDPNKCPQCGGTEFEVKNHNLNWHDGDVVCQDCKTKVRDYDAG